VKRMRRSQARNREGTPPELPLVLETARSPEFKKRKRDYDSYPVQDEFDIDAYYADHPKARLVVDDGHLIDVGEYDEDDEDYSEE